jgi:hypothetical protein
MYNMRVAFLVIGSAMLTLLTLLTSTTVIHIPGTIVHQVNKMGHYKNYR